MSDVNQMFNIAVGEIEKLEHNEVFTLRDLYKGYEWNRISRGDRITLGTLFLNFAKSNLNIELLGKNNSGQQSYKKIASKSSF